MGNGASNFFKQDWNAAKYFVSGVSDALKDTVTGLTGGGWHYGNVNRNFYNYANAAQNAWTGKTGGERSAPVDPAVAQAKAEQAAAQAAQAKATALSNFYDPNTITNRSLWQGSAVASYSPQGTLGGVTPPSHLNAISDPTTKVAIAGTRGGMRSTLQQYQTGTDVLASQQLATATGPPTASQATNSAGGTGVATSMDTK